MGKGIAVEGETTVTAESFKGLLSINNPNFNNTDKSVFGRIQALEIDQLTDYGYKTNRTGFEIGTRFEYLDDFFLKLGTSNYYERLETDNTASTRQQAQEGDYIDSFLQF